VNKEKYIEQGLLKLAESSLLALYPYGTLFIVLLSILDYFVTPENFTKFFIYRLITATLVLILFVIFKLKKNKTHYIISIFITITTLLVASMVELMIFSFGKHQSTYYAGMIVVITFILGFLHIPFRLSLLIGLIVYTIYLLPILLLDEITNIRIFMNNNIFLIGSLLGAFGWKYFNQKLNINKLSLEYDLARKNEQLDKYSNQLEELVAERTKELTIANKKYLALFENSNDGVAIMNTDGIILDVNKRFCELHGFDKDALIGTHFRILEVKENVDIAMQRMERIVKGDSLVFETEHYKKDGTKIALEVSSKAIEIEGELYIQSLYRDITEKRALQKQLFHSQKMEAIGLLAGGLAHDFRNILTAIHGYADIIYNFDPDPTAKKNAEAIVKASRRAEQMVTGLLQFAKKSSGEVTSFDINSVVNNVINLVSPVMLKENVQIEKELTENLPILKGDANQLEQVIMNLLINAKDAMPYGGRIKIETTLTLIDNEKIVHPLLSPGEHILIRVSDTGIGIPNEIKDRIFEPFFTTKGSKGTGLGLAIAYGAIRAHGGIIMVNSEPGKGST
jgi:PAS domain S-box-containing protein